jgi:hypothetical protein
MGLIIGLAAFCSEPTVTWRTDPRAFSSPESMREQSCPSHWEARARGPGLDHSTLPYLSPGTSKSLVLQCPPFAVSELMTYSEPCLLHIYLLEVSPSPDLHLWWGS